MARSPTVIRAIGILSSVFREAARRPRSTGVHGNPVTLLERPSAKRRRRPLVWGPVVVELASGMSLQRLARIQGHGIRVLDETYSEQLTEFENRGERIDPVAEIEAARSLSGASGATQADDQRTRASDRASAKRRIRRSSAAEGVTLPVT
jgi:hypothetical protein